MAPQVRFTLVFAPEPIEHLDRVESKNLGLLERSIREQLTDTPTRQTPNRKPVKPPAPFAWSWEIGCGPDNRFRVFYDVDLESREVRLLAIGIKDRNRLSIGGKE